MKRLFPARATEPKPFGIIDGFTDQKKLISESESLKKKIGLLFIFISSLTFLYYIFKGFLVYRVSFLEFLSTPSIIVVMLVLTASILSFVSKSRYSGYLHVVPVFIIASVSVVDNYDSFYGIGLFIIGFILMYRYGYLSSHFKLKSGILALLYIGMVQVSSNLQEPGRVALGLDSLIFLCLFLGFLWLAFERKIRELLSEKTKLISEKTKLEKEISASRTYAELGEQVGGIIHNLRNDLAVIQSGIYFIENGRYDGIESLLNGANRLAGRINNITGLITARRKPGYAVLNGADIMRGIVELFRSISEYKTAIDITQDLPKDLPVFGNGDEISQVLENIMKNSHEAVINTKKTGKVHVHAYTADEWSCISIRNDGGPIPECVTCTHGDCMTCELFQEGRTTKKAGSGIGLVFVRRIMKEINGKIQMHSTKDGVETVLFFRPNLENMEFKKVPADAEPAS